MKKGKDIHNVIVFINSLEKGGAELQAVELAKVLQERYRVFLVVFYGNYIHPELVSRLDNSKVTLIKLSGNKVKVFFELASLIKKQKIDCIYSFLATTNIYGAIIGTLCGVNYIIGGIRNSHYAGIKLLFQRFTHNQLVTLSIANNYSGMEFLTKKGFIKDKVKVIHNVFVPMYADYEKKASDKPCIISVARFVPEKDYSTALEAVKLLKNKGVDFIYRIIGYGILETEIRHKVKELGLEYCVDIHINPTNISNFLANADVFLQTSIFEGTSNAILEAMYTKLPIVATYVGDNSYMVFPENGFLCNVKDYTHIADKLELLLQDASLRKQMGERSREIVCQKFSLEAFRSHHFQLLDTLEKENIN